VGNVIQEEIMKKNLRSFLIPTVAAIATLISNPSYSSKHSSATQDSEKESKDRFSLDSISNEKFLQIAVDGELQNLILKRNESGQMLAYHYSHQSHSSHRSHSSHYSSR
jgi:hypothetical protein